MLFADGNPIHTCQSAEQLIEVSETGNLRLLRTDQSAIQSAIDLNAPQQLILPYMQSMMACLLFETPPSAVLLLGLGGGDIIRFLHHHLPETDITAVDMDPEMVRVATDYFKLPKSERIHIIIDDALHFLDSSKPRFDTLFVDLYGPDGLPDILKQDAFYKQCRASLSPAGVMVANLIVNDEDEFRQVLWKVRQHFQRLTLCMTVTGHSNVLIFAFQSRPSAISRATLLQKAEILTAQFGLDFRDYIENQFTNNPLEAGELIL